MSNFEPMKKILSVFFLFFCAASAQAEIVVIGNVKNNLESLNSIQVEDIFMGRTSSLPNGRIAQPIDQSALRDEFYQKLTARPIEQINAYWTRIAVTRLASLPTLLTDDAAVLVAVNKNKDAIGYIDRKNINNRVRVLLILN